MVDKSQIENNLTQISAIFQKHIGDNEAPYYSKLAILEVCGWIEESMDEIIRDCANKHLKDQKNLNYVEECIRDTHSFKYETNFRKMLIQTIGLINVEKLEHVFDAKKFIQMTSSLGELKQRRDDQAHTYVKDTTLTIDAPSWTQRRFLNVYEGLKDIEFSIYKIGL